VRVRTPRRRRRWNIRVSDLAASRFRLAESRRARRHQQRADQPGHLGVGTSVGYLSPIGVVAEIGADRFGNFDLWDSFDSFRLSQELASIGYQFDLGNRWRLVPRVGHAWWKLRTEEGRIFNPDPEATRTVHGESFFWEIGVARQISRVVTLGAAFRQGQYDFGRTQSAAVTVTLGF
jgi:hypothetical protein